jgi:hypothetical protein
MSAGERLAVERTIRQLEYSAQLLATLLILNEQELASQRAVLASEDAAVAQGAATRRRGYAAAAAQGRNNGD